MFPVGSWRIYEVGGRISTNSESVTIASTDSDSSGVSGSLTLISGKRNNRDIGMWSLTNILRCLVWKDKESIDTMVGFEDDEIHQCDNKFKGFIRWWLRVDAFDINIMIDNL